MKSVESPSVTFINQQISDPALQFSDHSIDVDGQRLHYVSAGSGKLILFYHGFPSYWYMWKNQLLDLAADYRVVAVDGLGANLSAKPNKLAPFHVSALSRQLNALAETLAGDQGFVLVGHDWGGALAWSYAQQYPQGLDKLVVLNAPPTNLFLELLRSNPEQRKASTYIARLKDA
ncbi:MAG: alpha/beta fold hydrolase, partial [Porticoccaceae bacterium]